MRKKILLTVLCIVIVILLKLICDYILNTVQVNSYKEEKYNADLAQLVATLNFNKSYAANYNYGNVLYKTGNYEGAIEQYKNALNTIVPSHEECDIRVNYALAICKTVKLEKEEETDEAKVNEAIKKYESAIDVLVEVECARRNDNNGHDKDAQQLKNDIQKEIDRLKSQSGEEGQEGQEGGEEENPPEENRTNENEITNKIEQLLEEGMNTQMEQNAQFYVRNFMQNRVEINW
jgi:tetratricopeptide (TPR) repeat protein